jgi:hypothetical protein
VYCTVIFSKGEGCILSGLLFTKHTHLVESTGSSYIQHLQVNGGFLLACDTSPVKPDAESRSWVSETAARIFFTTPPPEKKSMSD